MNENENKTNYGNALGEYIKARNELAALQAEYDAKRHTKRVELYKQKAEGAKITEEAIRSLTIAEFADLGTKLLLAQAHLDNITAMLNFYRDIYNKED